MFRLLVEKEAGTLVNLNTNVYELYYGRQKIDFSFIRIWLSEMKFEFLEHVSDIYVAAYGESLEEAFENAAMAMFEVMTDLNSVEQKVRVEVEVVGEDEESLLYNWLEELLIKFEVDNLLFSKFKVKKIEYTGDDFRLIGEAFGETFNPEKHVSKVGVKAVTYHDMKIEKEDGRVTVKVLFDI